VRTAIVRAPIDTEALLREVDSARNGASVLFVGTVREQNGGRAVTGIEYAAYGAMAQRELESIVAECCTRFGSDDVVAEHRIGYLAIGEASVAIAAAHPHRDQAYAASRFVIEQIKLRLPVWKREAYVDGTREWVGAHRDWGLAVRGTEFERIPVLTDSKAHPASESQSHPQAP
jgi:molybdopterin synthase catalytic subunit